AISIFLLTVVGMLGDSVSYSYVDYASQSAGKIDFHITGGDIYTNDVENQIRSDAHLNDVLGDFLPRSVSGWDSRNEWRAVNPVNNRSHPEMYHVGVDIIRENQAYQGKFLLQNGSEFSGMLNSTECLINDHVASAINIVAGQTVTFNRSYFEDDAHRILSWMSLDNYTVKAVVNFNFKFPEWIENAFIINISDWNNYWGQSQETCHELVINVKVPQDFYNTKDIPGTISRLRDVAESIQNRIGFYNTFGGQYHMYYVGMPRVGVLEIASYVNIGMSIILLFVSILGMVISGVLINGILTTSIEEKIREFGIFRVLGAHHQLPLKLTITQALVLSTVGTSIGILGGYLVVRFVIIRLIANLLDFSGGNVTAVLSWETLGISIGVGIGMSMLVGILPALKVSRMSILGAINPYRQESVGTKMVKEGNLNVKYIMIGAITSGIAAFVLFIVPQIIMTLDIGLIVAVLVILLTTFLLGATLVGLGLLPLVQNVIMKIFTALTRKTKDIIRISLLRYTRRNMTTVIMFSISFSFITLVSTILNTQSAQNIGEVRNNIGADLAIDCRSQWLDTRNYNPDSSVLVPDQNFAQDLLNYEGISKTSSILATTRELPYLQGVQYSLTMSDLVKYKSNAVHGLAIDENYLDCVYTQYIVFSEGNVQDAFDRLLHENNTAIISTALAVAMQLGLNDKFLFTFEWGEGESNLVQFTIVGVVDNLPGIQSVQKRPDSAAGSAVLLNQHDFKQYFQLPIGNYYVSTVFMKLATIFQNLDQSVALEADLDKAFGSQYTFHTHNSFRQGQFMQQIFSIIEILFIVILTFSVIISLFGLAASAYSTILERTREVGIVETLGLRKGQVATMFLIESEIIMVSAAINGAIIGTILVGIFYWQIAAFSTFPVLSAFRVPFDIIIIELIVAAIVCAIAMGGLVKRVQRMELMEIFRKTL
nr:FtsX-like permease family protein [Candidatus Sigynarchaeota archaeon]